jgi:NADH-quinone oxidoreductase subunit F
MVRKVLHRIENGHGREEDIDLLWSIQSKIEGNTICPLGDAVMASSSSYSSLEEFEYHVRFKKKTGTILLPSLSKSKAFSF